MADTEIVLLPEEDGRVGKVAVTGAQGTVLLERPFEGTSVTAGAAPLAPQVQPTTSIAERFAALLAFQQQSGFGDPGDLQKLFRITPDGRTDDRGGQGLEINNLAEATPPEEEESTDTEGDKGIALKADDVDDVGDDELGGEDEESDDAEEAVVDSLGRPPGPRQLADADEDTLDSFLSLLEVGRSLSRRPGSRRDRDDDEYDEFDGRGPGDDDDPFPQDDDDELFNGGDGGESLSGGIGKDTIAAGLGDDTLDGGAGQDLLQGGDGDDVLIGGPGADQLEGGPGIDVADYGASGSAVSVDLATGATSGGDAASDTLLGVENVIGSDFEDTLTGSDGGNRLDGRDGDDTLDGGDGDDMLVPGAGGDDVTGGLGNDSVSFEDNAVGVTVSLLTGVAVDLNADTDALTGIENVLGSDFDDSITGDDGDNRLAGRDGDDTLVGGTGGGDDTLDGGDGTDQVRFDSATQSVDVDLEARRATGAEIGTDDLNSIENVIGGAGDDNLNGNDEDNELSGGAGDDTLRGGEGSDALDGGSGTDAVSFQGSGVGVSVDLAAGTGTNGDADGDTFTGIENAFGSAEDDSLTGDGNANELRGEDGSDTLVGAGGVDTLAGGGGADSLLGGVGADELSGNGGNDTISGGVGADQLTGGSGDDVLEGGAAADQLQGGAGIDTASFAGAGEAVAFAFADTDGPGIAGDFSNTAAGGLAGDADGDSFASIEAFVGSDFGDTVGGGSIDMTFTLGAGDDRFDTPAGNDVADNLFGGDGADLAFTGDGNDSVEGGAGNDSLRGEAGSDTLIGNADNDDLSGAAGSDSLVGGAGVDTMNGGAGSDRFAFQALTDGTEVAVNDTIANVGAAVDVINDFATGVDLLEFASVAFGTPGLALTVGAYDGTNAIGVAGGATLVFDGTHLIFDPDVDQAGYVAIADLSGAVPVLADISLV